MSQFVNVFGFNNEEMRIPLMANRCLSLFNLQRSFPGAVGLKYKNDGDDVYTTLDFNNPYKYFEIPHGGWKGKQIHVIYDNYRPASPYSSHIGPLPSYDEVEKFCFKIKNDNAPPSAVVCIAPQFVATFKHTFHQKYLVDTEVTVTSHDDKKKFECVVKYVSHSNDFIILKAKEKILDHGPIISSTVISGENVLLIGHGNVYDHEKPGLYTGCIHSNAPLFLGLADTEQKMGPLYLCNIRNMKGDSGGSIFDSKGFLGMCVGQTLLPDEISTIKAYDGGSYEKKCFFVSASELELAVQSVDDTKPRPRLPALIGDDILYTGFVEKI